MDFGVIVFIVAICCCVTCLGCWAFGSVIPGVNTYVKPVTDNMSYFDTACLCIMSCIWLFVIFWFFVLRPVGMKATATGISMVA